MRTATPFFFSLLLAGFAAGMTACSEPEAEVRTPDNSPACLSESLLEMISLEPVEHLPLSRDLQLTGRVSVNPDKVFRIYPVAGGSVSDVYVRLGDEVQKGQLLATVQSPEIAGLQREELNARSQVDLAERNLRMVRSLIEAGVYSTRDLIEAERDLESTRAELERIRQRQVLKGALEGEPAWQVRAPESGFVLERSINPGMRVQPGSSDPLFTISGLDEIWILANIYESDIQSIRSGDEVEVRVPAWPERSFNGEIVRISNVLDPDRRVLEAVIELPNPDYSLKPGMFASVDVQVERSEMYSSIASESLIFDNNRYHVVVYHDECNLELREVGIHSRGNGRVFIESGLNDGESVVSSRQLFLYNDMIINRSE